MKKQTKSAVNAGFVQGAAILGIAGLLVKIIGAVYRIPLANIVGESGMAYYEVAYPYYSWLLVISSAGLPTAISKLVSERIALGDIVGAKRVFRAALRLLFVIGIVTAVLLFVLSSPIANLSGAAPARYSLMALSPALLFVSVMCAYRGYLQGMQCMTGTAISQIVEQLIKLIFGFGLAFLFVKTRPDAPELAAMGALIGVSVSELVALAVIKFYYDARIRNRSLPVCVSTKGAKSGLRGSIIKRLLAIANENARVAYTVLRSYVTPLINMPAVLTLSLSMSLVPAISQAVTRKEKRIVNAASRTGIKLAMFIGAPCAAGLFILGGPIMSLLYSAVRNNQDRFIQAQQVMYIAAVGVLFLSLVQTLTGIIQGLGKPRVPVYFLALGGIVKVVSMLVLMQFTSMGILGAALSTVLCYAVAGIADTVYVIRKTRMNISYTDTFAKPLFSSIVMGFAVFAVYTLGSKLGHPTLATLASLCVGVAVYGGLMILLRPFSNSDLEFLPKKDLFRRIFRVI